MEDDYDVRLRGSLIDEALPKAKKKPTKQEKKRSKYSFAAFLGYLGFSVPESLNFGTIFFMHFSPGLLNILLAPPMRFIVFPAAAIYGLIKSGFSWWMFHLLRKNYKEKKATREELIIGFIQSLWEMLNDLGTTGAALTGLVGFFIGASVGMGISITFNFFLAGSTALCAGLTGYYAYTAHRAKKAWVADEQNWKTAHPGKDENHPDYIKFRDENRSYIDYKARRSKAINNGLLTGMVALLTIGVAVGMVAGFPPIGAAIGVTACLCLAVYTGYNLYKHIKARRQKMAEEQQLLALDEPTNNAKMQLELRRFSRPQSFAPAEEHDTAPKDHAETKRKSVNDPQGVHKITAINSSKKEKPDHQSGLHQRKSIRRSAS